MYTLILYFKLLHTGGKLISIRKKKRSRRKSRNTATIHLQVTSWQ